MTFEIRPIRRDEIDHGLGLFARYQRFYGVVKPDDDRNRSFFARFADPSERGLLLAAWDDGLLVGFACLYWTFSSVSASDIALMNDLFVDERTRGRGIGRALIEAAADAARRRGLKHLEWYTAPDNITAQRVYDATGAKRTMWVAYEIPIHED